MEKQLNQDNKLLKAIELYKNLQEAFITYNKGLEDLGYKKIEGGNDVFNDYGVPDCWIIWCHPDYVEEFETLPVNDLHEYEIELEVDNPSEGLILPCFEDILNEWE